MYTAQPALEKLAAVLMRLEKTQLQLFGGFRKPA
jgi:hypothetical protein